MLRIKIILSINREPGRRKLSLIILFLIIAIQSHSQDFTVSETRIVDLTHLEQVFKGDGSAAPLDTVIYHHNKSFSPDKRVYIQSFLNESKYRVMTKENKLIAEIPYTSVYDRIIWLKNVLVVHHTDLMYPNDVLYVIDLADETLTTYITNGFISYEGNSDTVCYFGSVKDSCYVGDLLIPEELTIFAINEKGPGLTGVKSRDEDFKVIRRYYNEYFSFVIEKDSTGKSSCNFYYYDSVWTYNEPLEYFEYSDVYQHNGVSYVKFYRGDLYQFDRNHVNKIINCDSLYIEQFMIENNYLIYGNDFNYEKPSLGIINLETKEIHYPAIIQKSD